LQFFTNYFPAELHRWLGKFAIFNRNELIPVLPVAMQLLEHPAIKLFSSVPSLMHRLPWAGETIQTIRRFVRIFAFWVPANCPCRAYWNGKRPAQESNDPCFKK
jgi:hypothetical protein